MGMIDYYQKYYNYGNLTKKEKKKYEDLYNKLNKELDKERRTTIAKMVSVYESETFECFSRMYEKEIDRIEIDKEEIKSFMNYICNLLNTSDNTRELNDSIEAHKKWLRKNRKRNNLNKDNSNNNQEEKKEGEER